VAPQSIVDLLSGRLGGHPVCSDALREGRFLVDARLPVQPNLGFYRKLAKQLKRALLARDASATERLVRSHPRFRERSVAESLGAEIALADAQLILAREHGFATWAELRSAVTRAAAEPAAQPADLFVAAVRKGDASEVRASLARDPALARTPDATGVWPLIEACDRGRLDLVRLLLDAGADPSQPDAHTTPLFAAAHAGPHKPAPALDVVAELFARGVPRDVFAHALLGSCDEIGAAIARGADVNARGPLGATPIFLATWGGHVEAVRMLLGAGADARAPGREGQSVWQCVQLHLWSERHRAVARALLDHGLACSLHEACRLGHRSAVERMLAADPASRDRTDAGGVTPLDIAVLAADVELARLLLAAGAADPQGQGGALVDAEPVRERIFRGTVYRNCNFQTSNFHGVNLADATFSDVNLAGARFDMVNLGNARIDNAHIRGLTIYGIEVEPLLVRELEKRRSRSSA
jgi:ankyrin repeat protein